MSAGNELGEAAVLPSAMDADPSRRGAEIAEGTLRRRRIGECARRETVSERIMVTCGLPMATHALDALGNSVRRDILRQLRVTPLTAGELADRFPVSRPAISRHLRVLSDGGLVEVRPQGPRRCYRVRVDGFAPVRAFLDEFWDTALDRLAEIARR